MAQGLKWLFDPESPFYIKWRWDRDLLSWLWQFRRACSEKRVRAAMPLLRDLHLESLRLYAELAAELDFDFAHRGRLLLCRTQQGLDAVGEEAEQMRTVGLKVDILDAGGVRDLDDAVEFNCTGGAYYAQDAHVNPARFVRALAVQCRSQGVQIYEGTEVLGLQADGEAIGKIRTTRGDFQAGQVVLAGGAWSPVLAAGLDLHLPIQAAKGYSIRVEKPQACPQIPFMLTEAKVAATPMQDELRFAGTLELAGMDWSINQRRVDAMMRVVPDYVPAWRPEEFKLLEIWRGLRPCSPDGLPFLGRSARWENLTVAAGHAMIGLSLGPVTGEIVAQLVTGETPGFDLSLCRVERFA